MCEAMNPPAPVMEIRSFSCGQYSSRSRLLAVYSPYTTSFTPLLAIPAAYLSLQKLHPAAGLLKKREEKTKPPSSTTAAQAAQPQQQANPVDERKQQRQQKALRLVCFVISFCGQFRSFLSF
jgi:hypothetical protein